MKPIGGEIQYEDDGLFNYLTDSGRSSIRLFLMSGLKNKKFLLPDYLCKIVLSVFNELCVDYSFYKVHETLSIDVNEINKHDFDVLYLINYFGMTYHDLFDRISGDKFIIEDSVFIPVVKYAKYRKNWVSFNSFRKVSPLADGSLIKSSFELNESLIVNESAPFSKIKYDAKRIKNEYLKNDLFSEESYLSYFNRGEEIIDNQGLIYSISNKSKYALLNYYSSLDNEYHIRKENFHYLDKYLSNFRINEDSPYVSHYVLKLQRRDELRKYLFSKQIFLPVHWPQVEGLKNSLYETVISIPIDSRYNIEDMSRIANSIIEFFN